MGWIRLGSARQGKAGNVEGFGVARRGEARRGWECGVVWLG